MPAACSTRRAARFRNTLIEIWQANAAGRYIHKVDQHAAPLDPNFFGGGRCVTDEDGRYRFYTIKPGAYPWGNHHNAWRPNHIHLSLFGPTIATRLVTQMYFPGDPLLAFDPIYQSSPEGARERMISQFSFDVDGARFCARLRLRHRAARPAADADGALRRAAEANSVADGRPFLRLRAHRAAIRLRAYRHRLGRARRRPRAGRAHPHRRARARRGGHADRRRHDRALAGGFGGPLRAPGRRARLECGFSRLRPLRHGHRPGEALHLPHRSSPAAWTARRRRTSTSSSSCAAC